MPEIQDVEQFKSRFLSVGNEPSILAERGEKLRDVPQPESGLSDDLSMLLDEVDEELGIGAEPDYPSDDGMEPEPPEDTPDLDDFLASFGEQMDEEPFELEAAGEGEEVEEAGETGETGETQPADIFEADSEESEEYEEFESFELPGLDEEESVEEPADEFGLEPDSFDMPDFGEEEPAADAETEAFEEPEELEEPEEFESFELPDFDEEEPVEEAAAAEETDEFGFEPESFDMPDFGEEEASDILESDSFELPGLEEDEAEEAEEFEEPQALELSEFGDEEMWEEEPEDAGLPDLDAGFDAGFDDEEPEELLDMEEDDGLEIDEFSLGDLGQGFDILESESESFGGPDIDEGSPLAGTGGELAEAEEEEVALTEEEFGHLKEHLRTLPLNLKLAIEEQVGEKELAGPQLRQLLDSLKSGRPPREIANLVSKITGTRIKIPREYEKRTGTEFEEERDSFSYRFRKNVLPVIRTAVLTAALFALVIFLGYRFVYRPVKAYTLYQRGYRHLTEQEYPQSGSYFDEATDTWAMKGQFHRYALGYREAGQWPRAAAVYERLLARYPLDKQGTLEYAAMEFEDRADYPKAIALLDAYLAVEKQTDDYDVLLLSADVNLEWGREEPKHLEDARFALAKLMDAHGVQNEFLFRMLRYFIRTDNMAEVQILKNRFQADPKLEIDPSAYAELGGYLLDRGVTDEVNEILFRAAGVDETLPEIHYHLARFFGTISDREEERKALNNTILYLGRLPRLNGDRHFIYMDSYRRLGELHFADARYLEAEQAYRSGIELYESARKRGILPVKREAGILYADMADIPYYIGGDLDLALDYLTKAEANAYTNGDVKYKIGYIHYTKEDFRRALLRFSSAADGFSTDPNLNFAIANTLYRRSNLQAAEGYYRSLVRRLEERRYAIANFMPSEQSEHRALLENLIRVHNNLAVTRYDVYRMTGRGDAYTEALTNLSAANELFENYNRDPETLERSPLKNLAFLNQRGMIYPDSEFRPQIYPDIPKDLRTPFFSP